MHKCNLPRQLFILELDSPEIDEEEQVLEPAPIDNRDGEEETIINSDTPLISLYVLARIQDAQTIHVLGYCGKKVVRILLDGGSTHNFIDKEAVKRLGYTVVLIPQSYVSLGNNAKETTFGVVRDFKWLL